MFRRKKDAEELSCGFEVLLNILMAWKEIRRVAGDFVQKLAQL
jgi:hypothetical protein